MSNSMGLLAIFTSAVLIAAADSLIKKASLQGVFSTAVVSWLMVLICVLYFIQILLAVYIFIHHGELSLYANLFIIFYSILTVLSGVLIFEEKITLLQGAGIVLALIGAVLINGF